MDPKDQPQFNPKVPISEVLKQEQSGYTPSKPTPVPVRRATLNDVVAALQNNYNDTNGSRPPTRSAADSLPTSGESSGAVAPAGSQIKIIKTYKSDAAEAARVQQESMAKIAMAQEDQRRAEGEEIGAAPKKRIGLLITAIILILIGAAAIPSVNYILSLKTQAVPVVVEKTIIPFDVEKTLTLENATRADFLAALQNSSTTQSASTNFEYVKILEDVLDSKGATTTQVIAPDVFAGMIGPNMPSALARSFDSDYMYGIENLAGQNNPKTFILFKTSSYEQAFASMLKWETKMVGDMTPIFNLGPDAATYPFTDQVIMNKDVRAVSAPDGTIIFLYGFLDNQTLLITTDTQTFQDINNRYVAGQFVQ